MRSVYNLPRFGHPGRTSASDPLRTVCHGRHDGNMAKIAHRLRRIIDKEWIRVGWAGMPTLRHHLIAFAPVAVLLVPP